MAKLSKEEKYEANVRNGLYMWQYSCSINTVNNIQEVKEGKMYVPRYEEVKLRPCPKPPLKSLVINEVLIELEKKEKWRTELLNKIELNQIQVSQEEYFYLQNRVYKLNISQNHSPDIGWLLNVLSTLNPNHRYFERSFYPSNEELGGKGSKQKNSAIDEQDPFFEGLPDHISKRKAVQKALCNQNDTESKLSMKNKKYRISEAIDMKCEQVPFQSQPQRLADRLNNFILQMRQNDFQNQNNSQIGNKEIQNIFKQPQQNSNKGFQTQSFQICNEKSNPFLNHQFNQENQIEAMITKEFYAFQNPVQNNQSSLKKYSIFQTQASSANVSPSKVQMKTLEIKKYKIPNNSGLKINQIPEFKNNHSQLQSMKDQENSSQMDFQSISRQINQI